METLDISIGQAEHGSAFVDVLGEGQLQRSVPAAFAMAPDTRLSPKYTFISTKRVLDELALAGFVAVEARQSQTRSLNPLYARHIIRLRRRMETVRVHEVVPEILFLNSHDGGSAYQLRVGLFRAICENGLVISAGTFPLWSVSHRKDVIAEIIRGALAISERFQFLGDLVARMQAKVLSVDARRQFAEEALRLRYAPGQQGGMRPSLLLEARRPEDEGCDLWRTYNVVQENVLRGGQPRRTATNKLVRSRPIRAIKKDLSLNAALWDLARSRLEGR